MIPIFSPLNFASGDDEFVKAVQLFTLGQLSFARDSLARSRQPPSDPAVAFLAGQIESRLRDRIMRNEISIAWRQGQHIWEGDWLRLILRSVQIRDLEPCIEVEPGFLICVDNQLTVEKGLEYKRLFELGNRICLVHLSDEHFSDDLSAYQWCSIVIRNYWSPLLSGLSGVTFFPLGYRSGFSREDPIKPAASRMHTWGFAGDTGKSTRRSMVESLQGYRPGRLHVTEGFNGKNTMDVAEYRSFMDDCIFAPCPSGSVNLDSFRVYEALEAGCIPIVERREGFDYFTALLGTHPMITIDTWSDAPAKIEDVIGRDDVERIQSSCGEWWRHYKMNLSRKIGHDIQTAFRA